MLRPLSLLPARVAAAAVAAPLLLSGLVTGPVAPAAAAEEEDPGPLAVTIDTLSPGEVPEEGPMVVTGSVTNLSDQDWEAIKVYAFVGDTPMTTAEELAATAEVPSDAAVGERIVTPGTFDDVGDLAPGESTTYEISLRRGQLGLTEPGVYWFGAHALGTADVVRDDVADGRARTLLPLVPRPERQRAGIDRVEASVVVPLRRHVRHTRSGRLAGEARWAQDLRAGGRLRELLEFGAAAGNRPVTWVLDPALPDAVQHLVDGNLPRSLGETRDGPGQPDDGGGNDEGDGESPTQDPAEDVESAADQDAAPVPELGVTTGQEWLRLLQATLEDDPVLALPYGDLDVAAARSHAPELLRDAMDRSAETLARLDLSGRPAVAPPDGYLPPEALAGLPADTQVVLTDRMLTGPEEGRGETEETDETEQGGEVDETESAAATDGPLDVTDHRVLFGSSAAVAGGPGPDDPYATVAVRQRLLAEAAVRVLAPRPRPLVAVLPEGWVPDRPGAFWRGIRVPWLQVVDPTVLPAEGAVETQQLDYPEEQREQELPAANLEAAAELEQAGRRLGRMLTEDDRVDRVVAAEAMASASYADRVSPDTALAEIEGSLAWVQRRTRAVSVEAPPGVTLPSAGGRFSPTLTNRLDHPVSISLAAVTDSEVSVESPPLIELAARSSQTVLINARTRSPGVHYVRLVVTDSTGSPLGSSDVLPVRSSAASAVIWVVLAVGVGLLFLAIAVRLVRRLRSRPDHEPAG